MLSFLSFSYKISQWGVYRGTSGNGCPSENGHGGDYTSKWLHYWTFIGQKINWRQKRWEYRQFSIEVHSFLCRSLLFIPFFSATLASDKTRASYQRVSLVLVIRFSDTNRCFYVQEELEILRAKVERLEQERSHLKHDNDKLETKVRWHSSYTVYRILKKHYCDIVMSWKLGIGILPTFRST